MGAIFGRLSVHFPAHPRGQFRLGLRCCSPSVCVVVLSFCGVAARMFYKPRRKRAGNAPRNRTNVHETLPAQTPGERAQRASKGFTRSPTLAILMLALLSPRLLCCPSWSFALDLLAVLAALLVLSVACKACGSLVSRASRSMIAMFF